MKYLLATVLFSAALTVFSQNNKRKANTAEELVRSLYNMVSWEPNQLPDWNIVKQAFHRDVSVFLKTRNSMVIPSILND